MDSIYTRCSNAARDLLARGLPFTEADVVQAAATDDWTEEYYAEADRHAPQVLAALYRNSRLVRFGVVSPENAPLTGEPDYVRRDGFILYADWDAWGEEPLKTPNGTFQPILYRSDPIFKVGRRKASERDDFRPWAEQVPTPREPRPDITSLKREIARLRAEVEELRAENARLRSEPVKN